MEIVLLHILFTYFQKINTVYSISPLAFGSTFCVLGSVTLYSAYDSRAAIALWPMNLPTSESMVYASASGLIALASAPKALPQDRFSFSLKNNKC